MTDRPTDGNSESKTALLFKDHMETQKRSQTDTKNRQIGTQTNRKLEKRDKKYTFNIGRQHNTKEVLLIRKNVLQIVVVS